MDPKARIHQQRIERIRGHILKQIYYSRPHPIEVEALRSNLDTLNYPLVREDFALQIDYLRSKKLINCFLSGMNEELGNVEQSKLVQRYSSGSVEDFYCTLTNGAIDWIEMAGGHRTDFAVARV